MHSPALGGFRNNIDRVEGVFQVEDLDGCLALHKGGPPGRQTVYLAFASQLPHSVTSQCPVTGGRKDWIDGALCIFEGCRKGTCESYLPGLVDFSFLKENMGNRATEYYGMYSGFLKM